MKKRTKIMKVLIMLLDLHYILAGVPGIARVNKKIVIPVFLIIDKKIPSVYIYVSIDIIYIYKNIPYNYNIHIKLIT